MADYLHEVDKPLARYRDDEDLEKMLKDQERDDDPMLAYMKQKKSKQNIREGKKGVICLAWRKCDHWLNHLFDNYYFVMAALHLVVVMKLCVNELKSYSSAAFGFEHTNKFISN